MTTRKSIPKLHSIRWKSGRLAPGVTVIQSDQRPHIVPSPDLLSGALNAHLHDIVLIGYEPNGKEYFAFSNPDIQRAHYLLARGQVILLRHADK